jgi:hypothetical protein
MTFSGGSEENRFRLPQPIDIGGHVCLGHAENVRSRNGEQDAIRISVEEQDASVADGSIQGEDPGVAA